MAKHNPEERLERVNLMLTRDESDRLDQLAAEILAQTGAKVSRPEIVRAALSVLRELDRLAPACPTRFVPLHTCRSDADLAMLSVLTARWAARQ
jgi:hypothetical protein